MNSFLPVLVPHSAKVYVEKLQQILIEYKKIQDFLNDCVSPGSSLDTPDKQFKGIYLEAFCVGALSVLQTVNETICKIQDYMKHSSNGISWLYILNEYEWIPSVLASFNASIDMIKSGKFNGCKILDLCDKFINSGLPTIKQMYIKIQHFCLKKLYMQVKLWILQAILDDPYNDFFIKSVKSSSVSQHTSVSRVTNSISSDILLSNITNPISLSCNESLKYEINADNLPSLIPFSVAVKILFIGEALIMCQSNRSIGSNIILLEDWGVSEEIVISQFNEIENNEQFFLRKFCNIIHDLWIKINKIVREISEDVGRLSSELVLMSDIYLLGRGDLFHEFLLKGSNLLTADVATVSSRNLNSALRDAFYSVYLTDVSDLVDNFFFVLPNRKSLQPGIKTMDVLTLEYNVKWPLHYLFTQEVMKTYNKLFSFLLSLKKAQIVLTSVCKPINSINDHSLRTEFMEMKMHLLSIVVNLQKYCLTDVVTHEMNVLLSAVEKTDMFTDIEKIFSSFLYNVSNRLFISNLFLSNDGSAISKTLPHLGEINKKVYHCLLKIFLLCNNFSELLGEQEKDQVSLKLSDIKTDFYKVLKILFSLLNRIDQNYWYDDYGSGGHLFNLIMCLDYNRFYQKKFQLNFNN